MKFFHSCKSTINITAMASSSRITVEEVLEMLSDDEMMELGTTGFMESFPLTLLITLTLNSFFQYNNTDVCR